MLDKSVVYQKQDTMLPKPKHCGENWAAMQPAEGGRICGTCTKLIRDFSGCSWEEIERVQRENNYAVCGMYSRRQLEHWGQTPAPAGRRFAAPVLLATTAATLLGAAPDAGAQVSAMQAVGNDRRDAAATPPVAPASPAWRTVVCTGKAVDHESGEPLPGVNVVLKTTTTGAAADDRGEFRLELEEAALDSASVLVFSFIGYLPTEVPVAVALAGPVAVRMQPDASVASSNFYVVQPSLPKRVWWKVKRVFAGKPR